MRAITAGLIGLLLAVDPVGASAQSRPDTRRMSCGEARNIVARNGAIVMTTGAGTYERIVVGERFCLLGEGALPAFASTRDAGRCQVGFYCGQNQLLPFD